MPPPPSNDGTILFEATTFDSHTLTKETFYYNADSLISKIADTSGDLNVEPFITLEFLYDNIKELATITYYNRKVLTDPIYHIIKPNDHFKVLVPTYTTTSPGASDRWLGMDNKGRIIADTIFKRSTASVTVISAYTYDANGNMVLRDNYYPDGSGGYINTTSYTYTYDDKVNPFYNKGIYFAGPGYTGFPPVAYGSFCKNNVLTETVINKQAGGTSTLHRTYAYEYNKTNMPVKRTLTLDSGNPAFFEETSYKYK
jgi:hypothetical protein